MVIKKKRISNKERANHTKGGDEKRIIFGTDTWTEVHIEVVPT